MECPLKVFLMSLTKLQMFIPLVTFKIHYLKKNSMSNMWKNFHAFEMN